MTTMITHRKTRFAIGPAGGSRWRWHAVDLTMIGPRLDAAVAEGCGRHVEVYSVCGQSCGLAHKPFADGSRWMTSQRCERCGWVVAFNLGTVEQEVDQYTPDRTERAAIVAAGGDPDLLRRIFVAILADAPPPAGDDEPGHRSDLLAHAARHRPVVTVCKECAESSPTVVHRADVCPESAVVCAGCTFTAGEWEGMTTGECVVAAPCSVLTTLAQHYGALRSLSC